jgi:hypothetical protein
MEAEAPMTLRILSIGLRGRVGLCLVAAALAGCSAAGSKATVTGRVIRGGKTLVVPLEGMGAGTEVTLVALQADGRTGPGFQSDTDPQTGEFRIRGLPAKPLTPGRYRVAVTFPNAGVGNAEFGPQSSPLVVEIPARDVEIEVDLDARQVRIR